MHWQTLLTFTSMRDRIEIQVSKAIVKRGRLLVEFIDEVFHKLDAYCRIDMFQIVCYLCAWQFAFFESKGLRMMAQRQTARTDTSSTNLESDVLINVECPPCPFEHLFDEIRSELLKVSYCRIEFITCIRLFDAQTTGPRSVRREA